MRVAAIDLGTNTTRLLVADVVDGALDVLLRREEITRLGESVDRRRILLPTAIARVRNVLVDYRREAEELGAERVLAVATSAVRDAENGEAFLGEIEWSYGFATRLLSGEDEAATMLRGVLSDARLTARTLLVDIGGGSTELVVAGPDGVESAVSTEAGSVRLTERFLHADPPGRDELDACTARVRALLPPLEVDAAIGVAGTVTTAASIELGGSGAVHGHRLTRQSVDETLGWLASLPLHRREQVAGLAPARAPVIVAGLVVLSQVLARYEIAEVRVSERDVLDGAALEAAALPKREEGPAPPSAYTCC